MKTLMLSPYLMVTNWIIFPTSGTSQYTCFHSYYSVLYWINNTPTFHGCLNFLNEVESQFVVWNSEDWWLAKGLKRKEEHEVTSAYAYMSSQWSTGLCLVASEPVALGVVWYCQSAWLRAFLQMLSDEKWFLLLRYGPLIHFVNVLIMLF